jgi:hypothetical protein
LDPGRVVGWDPQQRDAGFGQSVDVAGCDPGCVPKFESHAAFVLIGFADGPFVGLIACEVGPESSVDCQFLDHLTAEIDSGGIEG